ncbi:MAG: MFS transporter [Anaerolineales bacterium]|nr:MFS transporter [Anaerolineales bacterium]
MTRPIHWYDYITFSVYFLGLTTLSQTMGLVIPLLVQQFVGEAQKGTYFGTYRLWTLMVALLAQALFGLLSDRSRLRWGRRRPFIFTGTLLDLVFIVLIGFTAGMEGLNGFWIMFGVAMLLQVSSNMAHAATQGVIPDLVPEEKRGRFSGVKAMLELPVPLILVSFTVGKMVSQGNMWGGLGVGMAVIVLVMLLSMLIPEKRPDEAPKPLDWKPFLRLVMMTAVFTLIILGAGQVVQLFSDLLDPGSSPTMLFVSMGLFGLAGMAFAVGVGVWLSVQVGIGEDAKKTPSFTWWVVNRLAFLVGATNLSTFAVYYLQGRLGFEREKAAGPAAFLMLFVGVFILLSALPSGWLADKFGKKRMVALSGFIAALGTLVAILVPSLPVIYAGGVIIGIATGLFFASNWALGTVLVPKQEAGRYLGISNLAGAGAGAVGAYIGGPIADYFTVNVTSVPGLGYMLLFAIYGVMFLLSVLALRGVRENK